MTLKHYAIFSAAMLFALFTLELLKKPSFQFVVLIDVGGQILAVEHSNCIEESV